MKSHLSAPATFLFTVLICAAHHSAAGQSSAQTDSLRAVLKNSGMPIENRTVRLYDVKCVRTEDWTELYRIPEHPAFDSLLTPEKEREILAQINHRRREFGSDTMLTADYFHIWRPYFDWLQNEDPHYRIFPRPAAQGYKNYKQVNRLIRRLPFTTYTINDTVVINRSIDPLFRAGDMLTSINGVPMSEYLKYCYGDRYSSPLEYMIYYYFSFAVDDFRIRLVRDGRETEIATRGMLFADVLRSQMGEEYDIKVYEDAGCGYIQIKKFYPNNNRLIKIVRSAITGFKKRGITDVVLDLRRNPGGNGHSFDKLLSIFIDKPSIPYMRGQKLRVSDQTLGDYDFLTSDMVGRNVAIPDEYIMKEIGLDPKMYIGGMNYYVLVSAVTGSVAASFANILQYNDAAKLVGEPLMRGALKYGEAIPGDDLLPTLLVATSISTMEFDEFTRAVDGVLTPDIHIPYVAADYLSGRDGVLVKFLETLKGR